MAVGIRAVGAHRYREKGEQECLEGMRQHNRQGNDQSKEDESWKRRSVCSGRRANPNIGADNVLQQHPPEQWHCAPPIAFTVTPDV